MKKIICILIFFISSTAFTQEVSINNDKSSLSWTGKAAFNAYKLTGTLEPKSGKLIIKNDSIHELKVTVDMKSLDHTNKDLKSHLRSKDFFEVKKFTEAFFYLTEPIKLSDGEYEIEGKMKIKDKTKLEKITVKVDKFKNEIKMSFETILNRLDYGVKYNSPSIFKKLKENAIADEFVLKGELFFESKK